jgi:gas vesicle protein
VEEDEMANNNAAWIAGICVAACAGVAIGMLCAPKSGKETRAMIAEKIMKKSNGQEAK